MICPHCGTECDGLPDGPEVRDDDKFIIHGPARCRDALKAQLASMTKRAEDAERCVANYVEMMKGAIRALGIEKIVDGDTPRSTHVASRVFCIDPTKEQGK